MESGNYMSKIKHLIISKIMEYDKIIIHRHVNPDLDALGSQGGLQKIIKETFPEKTVYVVGEETDGLNFLIRMDNIVDEEYKGSLVIVCDTANTERISDGRYNQGDYIIKIDHHPDTESYGDMEWVDVTYSSTSEMITDLFDYSNGEFNMNEESAMLLYAGIVGDTGRFLYNNTTTRTLKRASTLLQYDFNPFDIYDNLYKTGKEVARFQGYILQNFKVSENGVAYLYISKDIMEKHNVNSTEAANSVNTLANIEGNNIWVFFVESDDSIRVRIRSKEVEINSVAREFNGGGHPLASGASVVNVDEFTNLISALDNLLK